MDDGDITSGIRVISVDLRILVIVSSSLTHPRGVGYDTDIFTDDSAVHAHVNFRTRAESHILSHLLSLEIYLTRII